MHRTCLGDAVIVGKDLDPIFMRFIGASPSIPSILQYPLNMFFNLPSLTEANKNLQHLPYFILKIISAYHVQIFLK